MPKRTCAKALKFRRLQYHRRCLARAAENKYGRHDGTMTKGDILLQRPYPNKRDAIPRRQGSETRCRQVAAPCEIDRSCQEAYRRRCWPEAAVSIESHHSG